MSPSAERCWRRMRCRDEQRASGRHSAPAGDVPREGAEQLVLRATRAGPGAPRQRNADAVALPQRPPDHVPRGSGGSADGARRLSGRQEQYVRRGRGGMGGRGGRG